MFPCSTLLSKASPEGLVLVGSMSSFQKKSLYALIMWLFFRVSSLYLRRTSLMTLLVSFSVFSFLRTMLTFFMVPMQIESWGKLVVTFLFQITNGFKVVSSFSKV